MFKEIKRRITLFNTLILIVFLVVFIFVLSFLIRSGLRLSGQLYLQETAQKIINNTEDVQDDSSFFKNNTLHDNLGYEYIEWSKSREQIAAKVSHPDLIRQGFNLIDRIGIDRDDVFDTVTIKDSDYRVYTTLFERDGNQYILQVFQQINTENSVIAYVISFLLFIGCGSILLLIPISYFQAGRALRPIKETFDDQKKFIADASHELRTPLTVIQTNVEVLKMKDEAYHDENRKWLNNIGNECETMASLISQLLLIAQSDNKKIVVKKECFDMSALCAEIVDLMFDVAKDNQILLKGQIAEGIDYNGDEERLKQAIRILVDNAIKYTEGPGQVTLKLSETKRQLIIAVTDTGIGLSEEDQKKIFSRFYRVDDARSREKGGVGLGLNIADVIVRQHNGKITIDSKLNEGSTFSILLPKSGKIK